MSDTFELSSQSPDRKIKVKFVVSEDGKKVRLNLACKDELTYDDIRDVIDQLESMHVAQDGSNH